jgi:sugar (pentulose or hexulose) kinase
VGAGLYPDLQTAAQRMVAIEQTYAPDLARHEEYQFFVRQYQETYQRLRELMRRMHEKQNRKQA